MSSSDLSPVCAHCRAPFPHVPEPCTTCHAVAYCSADYKRAARLVGWSFSTCTAPIKHHEMQESPQARVPLRPWLQPRERGKQPHRRTTRFQPVATIAARNRPSRSCVVVVTRASTAQPSASLGPGVFLHLLLGFPNQPIFGGAGRATRKCAARCRSSARHKQRSKSYKLAPRVTSAGCARRRCLRAQPAEWRTTAAKRTSTTPGLVCSALWRGARTYETSAGEGTRRRAGKL
jgi:hypothetical protein